MMKFMMEVLRHEAGSQVKHAEEVPPATVFKTLRELEALHGKPFTLHDNSLLFLPQGGTKVIHIRVTDQTEENS